MKNVEYFIEEQNRRIGPVDLLTLVRRIRRGKLAKETLIFVEGMPEALPAYLVPEIKSVFDDQVMIDSQPDSMSHGKFSFVRLMKDGFEFFKFNQSTAMIVGGFFLVAAVGSFIFSLIPFSLIAILFSGVWGYCVFCLLQVAMLKKARMQLLSPQSVVTLIKQCGVKLLLVSLVTLVVPFFIPAIVSAAVGPYGWFLLLVPGSFAWTYVLFVPFILTDLNVSVKKAFSINNAGMKKMGIDNFSVIYLLLMVNIIVAPLLVPLLITLPITLCALCEVYDSVYN